MEAVQRVRAYMTPSPLTITPDLSVADAAERMFANKIRHLPVIEGERLIGMVTERDLAVVDALTARQRQKIPVRQVMRTDPYTCHPDEPIREVVKRMVQHKLGSVVCLEAGRIVGVFTTVDAMRRLVELCQMVELLGA